ncbi:MAG: SRPBCC family protein [Actinomycetota bacterium]|nr:SRPBCC family protein [Actinomycetota bacterium]
MGSYRAEALIAAPAHRVWAVLADIDRWPVWTKSVRKIRTLDDRQFGLGSRVRISQPGLGTATWVVDEWTPNTSFTWSSALPGVQSTAQHRILPQPDGGVRVILTIQQTGRFAERIERHLGKKIERYMRMEAEGLRRSLQNS